MRHRTWTEATVEYYIKAVELMERRTDLFAIYYGSFPESLYLETGISVLEERSMRI